MASQALYRRYRSQTFDELVGQEHIVQTLRNAMADGRIAHAYLFTGPRGVGKTTVARLLAKGVNCTADAGLRPCGACDACTAIAEGRFVDVIEMDAASHTSVEDAREIIERVQFRPSSGAYKVYIIDETHMLSTAAFNALLKTLEEPPGHALFILATTEIHKVPATILSRCQKFTFNRHSVAAIAAHLQAVAEQEQFVLEPGVSETLARAATGSMRDALSVLDQLMAFGGDTITLVQVQNLLGSTSAQEVGILIDALIGNDMTTALRAIANVADQGADLRQFARDLVDWLRGLMLLKAGGDPSLLDATEDELALLSEQANAGELSAFLHWVKLFSGLDTQIRNSAIPQLPLELAVVEALALPVDRPQTADRRPQTADRRPQTADRRPQIPQTKPTVADHRPPTTDHRPLTVEPSSPAVQHPSSISTSQPLIAEGQSPIAHRPSPIVNQSTVDGQSSTEPPPAVQDVPVAVTETSAPAAETPPEAHPYAAVESFDPPAPAAAIPEVIASENAAVAALEQVESVWQDVVRDVRVFNKMLQALLNSGVRPVDVQDNVVVLEAANEFLLGRLDKPELRQIVERVLSKHTGTTYVIRCVVEAQHRENPNVLREQIRDSRKDPLVKAAINIFDADIIAVQSDE